ncbi:hypothetical protein HC028_18650 [Planosporangium flavigriseum]|uniref:VOC domain-containing protein n=1 Tax=Planosporangium flavigriseum TaxID=373681 RepID=A0A8J3PQ03_9ACTN|nr:VOC family protein [Planosporangium flavigriseum]NJC66509.1 hypothetical protein [Planosporangium flavigriseum]GIG76458.1 hypothetical protein Pfl04_48620 [Planosporangium flavigriseum]
MASASRWSLSARQGFLACGLVTVGLFLLPCGAGMGSIPIAALGVAIGLLGPAVILLSSVRANRPDVFGTAHVSQSSPPPATGVTGPADLQLVVNAKGVHNAVVRVRDAKAPVSKWPDVGATLPVLIPNGNPRRLQVLWDQVSGHHDLAMDDVSYAPYVAEYVDERYPPDEPMVEQTMVIDPVTPDPVRLDPATAETVADESPEQPAAPTDAPAAVGVRRRPSPRPRRDTPPADRVEAVVPVGAVAPSPATGIEPSPQLPRRVPGASRTEPNGGGIPVFPDPVDEADVLPESTRPDQPDPYVASYLADEPEEEYQQGVGGVHNVSVTMIVSDLRRSLAFYRDVLGLTEIDGGSGSAILASGNARILLRQVADAEPVDRRVVHLNLEVDDVHEAYQRLRRQGVEFMHEPSVVDQGEQLEQWAATLRDPDGHAIALTHWEVRS